MIGIAEDELEASVQVFFVRKGRVVGRKGLVVDKVEDLDTPRSSSPGSSSSSTTTRRRASRSRCSSPSSPEDLDLYEEFLTQCRGSQRRGARRRSAATSGRCWTTVTRNATEEFTPPPARARVRPQRARAALNALQDALDLPEAPLRIECFDISNLQGTEIVGSMVVMEDGFPNKRDYRRFKVKDVARPGRLRGDGGGAHPSASALPRRARRPSTSDPARFPYPPNLLLVDGGKGQLVVAVEVLEELGLSRTSPSPSLGEAVRRGLPARRSRPGPHPAALRGAVPAAAGPRRSAPLRHHVPPAAARQEHDDVACSTTSPGSARPARSGCARSSVGSRA